MVGLGALAYDRHEANARTEAVGRARVMRDSLDAVRLDLILPGDAKAKARGIARAEAILASYGLPDDDRWMDRPEVKRLSEVERPALAADLGELLLLVARAKWQEVESKGGADHQAGAVAALKLNLAARGCFPADAVPALLERQTAEIAFAAGVDVQPPSETNTEPTPRGLFLDAAAAITNAKYAEALPLFERVVKDQPNHAVGQFFVAYSKEQLGRHDSALERYEVAQSLMPKAARIYFHRGIILGMRAAFQRGREVLQPGDRA